VLDPVEHQLARGGDRLEQLIFDLLELAAGDQIRTQAQVDLREVSARLPAGRRASAPGSRRR
jgi:hypothetical protein